MRERFKGYSIKIPPSLVRRLDAEAHANGMSRAEAVRAAIREWLLVHGHMWQEAENGQESKLPVQ